MPEPGGLYYTEDGELDREAVDLALKLNAGGLAVFQLLENALLRTVLVASPAAGADWTVSVPGGSTWEVLTVSATLVTSAVVANRTPVIAASDGNTTFARYTIGSSETASATFRAVWSRGYGDHLAPSGSSAVDQPLGETWIPGGGSLAAVTTNLDVGDQWSAIALTVREWSPGRVSRYLRYLLADLDASGGIL